MIWYAYLFHHTSKTGQEVLAGKKVDDICREEDLYKNEYAAWLAQQRKVEYHRNGRVEVPESDHLICKVRLGSEISRDDPGRFFKVTVLAARLVSKT